MEPSQYLQILLGLIIVVGLMILFGFILKKFNQAQSGMMGKNNRIQIVEQRMVDHKNKAVIIRCDDKDHLVLIGQNGHTVIKGDLNIPKIETKKGS